MPLDDLHLLLGIARGRDDCARELWSRHGAGLTALARANVGEHAASDVVQCALCRVLEISYSRLREIENVPAWLATLVRRESANHMRSERRRRQRDQVPRANAQCKAFPLEPDRLWDSVDRLPRRLREIIVLKLIAGLTFDQLSIALGLNKNTAAARYRAALESLRASVGQSGHELSIGGSAYGS
jgi:RNA polymerase sigma-70 factor (ECF subfamily)